VPLLKYLFGQERVNTSEQRTAYIHNSIACETIRAKFRLSEIKDIEGLIYKLSEVGVSLGDIYRQLAEGKEKNIEFYVEGDRVSRR
jgi:hypothetical protein